MLATAERLVRVQNIRAFEHYLSARAAAVRTPCATWASATVAHPALQLEEPTEAVVVVLVGLRRRAWLALGALHLLARIRLRAVLGDSCSGYRIRIGVTSA